MNVIPSVAAAAAQIKERSGLDSVDTAIVLGSGWKAAAEGLGEHLVSFDASELDGFATSVVPGHTGTLRVIRLPNGRSALVIGARTHLYEGRGIDAVVHGVRTSAALGARSIVFTNGAGCTNDGYQPSDVVIISDHINMTATSPISGSEFVDLTNAYSPTLRAAAARIDPDAKAGVYCQLPGPHYETPAEVHMLRTLGADVVGMSTVLEVIEARRLGLDVLGLTLVTNYGAGLQSEINHDEVLATGSASGRRLRYLLSELLPTIAVGS